MSLFAGTADADLLAALSQMTAVPARFADTDPEKWLQVLGEAAAVGLLTPAGGGLFGIQPALPAYLAAAWAADAGEGYPRERAAAETAMVEACAALADWAVLQIESGDAAAAFRLVEVLARTLARALDRALYNQRWDQAQRIVQPLSNYWDAAGLAEEARAWTDRILLLLEDAVGTPPGLDTDPGQLWLFLAGSQADRNLAAGRYGAAGAAYTAILTALTALTALTPADNRERNIAATYHKLGRVAQDRGDLDKAEDWYLRSLTISEGLGDRPGQALTYAQLGLLAEQPGDLAGALGWSVRAVALFDEVPHRATGSAPAQMARLTRRLGRPALVQAWQETTGTPVPAAVLDFCDRYDQANSGEDDTP